MLDNGKIDQDFSKDQHNVSGSFPLSSGGSYPKGTAKSTRVVAFLTNLLVLPGVGTLIVGKRIAGYLQLLMVFLSLLIMGISVSAIVGWATPLFGDSGIGTNPETETGFEIANAYIENPPKVFQFIPAFPLMFVGLLIFLIVWVWSWFSALSTPSKIDSEQKKLNFIL